MQHPQAVIKYHRHLQSHLYFTIWQLSTGFSIAQLLLKIISFSADQAPVVEVKGPTVGGKDVGAGQDLKQQQQH